MHLEAETFDAGRSVLRFCEPLAEYCVGPAWDQNIEDNDDSSESVGS